MPTLAHINHTDNEMKGTHTKKIKKNKNNTALANAILVRKWQRGAAHGNDNLHTCVLYTYSIKYTHVFLSPSISTYTYIHNSIFYV